MCKKDPAKFFFSPEKDLRDYYPLCGLVLLEGNVKQDGLICPENRASLLTFPLFSCSLNLSSRATATVWLPAPSAALPPQLGSSQITWLVQSQPRYCSLSTSFLSVRPPAAPRSRSLAMPASMRANVSPEIVHCFLLGQTVWELENGNNHASQSAQLSQHNYHSASFLSLRSVMFG